MESMDDHLGSNKSNYLHNLNTSNSLQDKVNELEKQNRILQERLKGKNLSSSCYLEDDEFVVPDPSKNCQSLNMFENIENKKQTSSKKPKFKIDESIVVLPTTPSMVENRITRETASFQEHLTTDLENEMKQLKKERDEWKKKTFMVAKGLKYILNLKEKNDYTHSGQELTNEERELFKAQLRTIVDDFNAEREDREKAHKRVKQLEDELSRFQNINRSISRQESSNDYRSDQQQIQSLLTTLKNERQEKFEAVKTIKALETDLSLARNLLNTIKPKELKELSPQDSLKFLSQKRNIALKKYQENEVADSEDQTGDFDFVD